MVSEATKQWESLFRQALALIDSVEEAGVKLEDWTFGGGTVLMRRHMHRLSRDIDIFVGDPQYFGYLTPRLNSTAEAMTGNYIEQAHSLKLVLSDGEIDFVASAPLTSNPFRIERIFERDVRVETSTEIVAKKLWHRGDQFTARDIFDLAMVAELEPEALEEIVPILQSRRDVILSRIDHLYSQLEEGFKALVRLDYQRSFAECVDLVAKAFARD